MKILLVDNHTQHMKNLMESLAGHIVQIQKYEPGVKLNWQGKDLVILSGGGGEGQEICDEHKPGHLWYEDELKLVRNCKVPIIGICMGFEVIARAYGAEVTQAPSLIKGFQEVRATDLGARIFGYDKLRQFESHEWCVQKPSKNLKILAHSKTGIEAFVVEDKKSPKYAFQFHPEKGGTLNLKNLLNLVENTALSNVG